MKRLLASISVALFTLTAGLHAQTPQVSASKTFYKLGEDIAITFADGPANPKDWVGIYPVGVEPGSQGSTSTIWFYVDGTKAGDNGLASGTIQFPGGLSRAGEWVAYLLEDDGYNKLASEGFTTGPLLSTDKKNYQTNETIAVTFAYGPGNPKDWIGIYREGETPGGGPNSTLWNYVNGTQTPTIGQTSGTIVFTNGLPAGKWVAYLLEDDGYTTLATNAFSVGRVPTVSTDHSAYYPLSPITVSFTNAPANPKDWIGIYPEGAALGDPPASIWQYTDANGGKAGVSNGTVTFAGGLTNAGVYIAYLLENDGYNIVASNSFSILSSEAPLLWMSSRVYQTREAFTAYFTNAPGNIKDWIGIYPAGVTPGSEGSSSTLWYYLDGTRSGIDSFTEGAVSFSGGLNQPGAWVAYLLEDDGYNILAQETFTVVEAPHTATNIVLGTPIYFEDFEGTPEGQLPTGWTSLSYSEVFDENLDLTDLNSKTYANWVVVDSARFRAPLLSYSAHTPTEDYQRVLSTNLNNLVNGVTVTNLAQGHILFGDSGYRDGRSQVLFAFTPDYNLTGKSNVYLSFHSLYEQNQDSIGTLEYSVDGGTNWLPIIYMIDAADVITNDMGQIDAIATLTTEYPADVAYYDDPETGETKGGTYGAFIAAPITQELAPYISGRRDDDAIESKRVEYFPLPAAENQARVRFRIGYAGTDSWYWGIDDFGLYTASSQPQGDVTLSIARAANSITISWGTASGTLQRTTSLAPANWQPVAVPSGATSFTEDIGGNAAFYRFVQ